MLQRQLEQSRPPLAECGGAARLFVVAPPDFDLNELRAQFAKLTNDPVTLVQDSNNELVICHEIEQIPLDNVLAQLIGSRQDILELARRLHTRRDVNWSL